MDSCCSPVTDSSGTNTFFSRWSKRYARNYRKKGVERIQQYLLDGVRREPIEGQEILDIGCGVGSLHLTLLKQGALRSIGVEVSEGMIQEAQQLASELGVRDRTSYLHGDFVDLAHLLPESDITLLDKVVCCYERLDLLIEKSSAKTKRIYAISHPKDNVPMRVIFKTQIALARVFRWSFRPFWHDWARMKSQILARGFSLLHEDSTIAWQVLVFKRA